MNNLRHNFDLLNSCIFSYTKNNSKRKSMFKDQQIIALELLNKQLNNIL